MQNLYISRNIKYQGAAEYSPNIEGNPRFGKVVFHDDFLGDVLQDYWAPSGDNGGTEAITEGKGGTVTLTTGATSEDRSILAGGLNWYCSQNPFLFARMKIDNITTVGINMGFNDAKTEANDNLAFEISTATIVDRCTNGVAWVFDTDATAKYWHMCNTKAGTQAGTAHGTNAPVNATYVTLGIGLDTLGNATFYYNDKPVGYKPLAITTTTALTPFFGVIARTTAARVGSIDVVDMYQDRE